VGAALLPLFRLRPRERELNMMEVPSKSGRSRDRLFTDFQATMRALMVFP